MSVSPASTSSTNLAIKQSNFVSVIDNPLSPYIPGTVYVYTNKDGSFVDTVTVTHDTKIIDGVRCVAVQDIGVQDGHVEESTIDYFAQDKNGNVWYFGEDTKEFDANGNVISTEGSFLAGKNGAQPGIIMEAHPQIGDSYDQENAPGVAQDHAVVVSLTGSANVEFGHFSKDLLVTLETTPLEPGAAENKYYAVGIGEVFAQDLVTGDQERLVSVTPPPATQTSTAAPAVSATHHAASGVLGGGHDLAGLDTMLSHHDHGHLFLG